MNLTISRDLLQALIASVMPSARRELQASCVLLKAGEELIASSFDGDVAIRRSVSMPKIEERGELAVQAERLGQLVASLPAGDVVLCRDDRWLSIQGGRGKYGLPVVPGVDHSPAFGGICEEVRHGSIDALELKRALTVAEKASGDGQVVLLLGPNGWTGAACDGGGVCCDIQTDGHEQKLVLPAKMAGAVHKALTDSKAVIYHDGGLFAVQNGSMLIRVPTMDAVPRDFRRPTQAVFGPSAAATFQRAAAIEVLKRAALSATDENNFGSKFEEPVVLTFTGGECQVAAKTSIGSADDAFPCELFSDHLEGVSVKLMPRPLVAGLSRLKDGEIHLGCSNPAQAIAVKAPADPALIFAQQVTG